MHQNQKKRLIDIDDSELAVIVEAAVERVLNKRLPPPPPIYYTFAELTKILNCSRVTLHNLRATGHLQCHRPDGMKRILVSQEQLDRFLVENPGWAENGEVHGEGRPSGRRRKKHSN